MADANPTSAARDGVLTRLYVDNFKSLVNFDVKLGRVNLLVGANGAGKSNVMEVLEKLQALLVLQQTIPETFPRSSLTRWQRLLHQRFELEVEGNGGTYQYKLDLDFADPRPAIRSEALTFGGKTLFAYGNGEVRLHDNSGKQGAVFPFPATRSFIPQIEERPASRRLVWFRDQFLNRVWLGRVAPAAMTELAMNEVSTLRYSGQDFAEWYRHLVQERPEVTGALVADLREIFPGLKQLKLAGDSQGRSLKFAFEAAPGKDTIAYELGLTELSDGQRALLVLYTVMHAMDGELLCIDEPDNYLALREIQPWLVRVADRARERGQLVVVSHNSEVVDYLAAERVLLLERPNGGATRAGELRVDLSEGQLASEALREGLE